MSWQIQIKINLRKVLWAHETEHPTPLDTCYFVTLPNELYNWGRDTVSGYPILTAVNLL